VIGKEVHVIFIAVQNCPNHLLRKAIRFPRIRVRFMNQRGNAAHPSGQNWRGRSKSAHTKDNLRFELLVNRSTAGKTLSEPSNESENFRRINGRKTNRRQFLKPELRSGRKRETVDLFFRNEQEYLVSAFAQNFS